MRALAPSTRLYGGRHLPRQQARVRAGHFEVRYSVLEYLGTRPPPPPAPGDKRRTTTLIEFEIFEPTSFCASLSKSITAVMKCVELSSKQIHQNCHSSLKGPCHKLHTFLHLLRTQDRSRHRLKLLRNLCTRRWFQTVLTSQNCPVDGLQI